MKLEEYLIGTRKEMSDNIDKLEDLDQIEKYSLKWVGYTAGEAFASYAALLLAEKSGIGALNVIPIFLLSDACFRTVWAYISFAKEVYDPRINAKRESAPEKSKAQSIEPLKGFFKNVLKPGLVGVIREYISKK